MTTPTTQPDDRCDQIAREKYYQTGDTCPCCGIGTYLPSGVCDHCDIHRDSEYAAHRRSRILKHENQQPKSEDEVLRQLRQEVAPRIQALKESERNVFEQPKSEPSQECREIAVRIIADWANGEECYHPKTVYPTPLRIAIAAALQAKQDRINKLEEVRDELMANLDHWRQRYHSMTHDVEGVLQVERDELNALREEVLGVISPITDSSVIVITMDQIRAALALREKLKASQPTSPPQQTPHQ